MSAQFARYASPWGVMRCLTHIASYLVCHVTHPHEGLWDYTLTHRKIDVHGLRIPMRGYEHKVIEQFQLIKCCYASPWGVMRCLVWEFVYNERELRIPMRGYEVKIRLPLTFIDKCYASPWGVMRIRWFLQSSLQSTVTHPHEGLWDKGYLP